MNTQSEKRAHSTGTPQIELASERSREAQMVLPGDASYVSFGLSQEHAAGQGDSEIALPARHVAGQPAPMTRPAHRQHESMGDPSLLGALRGYATGTSEHSCAVPVPYAEAGGECAWAWAPPMEADDLALLTQAEPPVSSLDPA